MFACDTLYFQSLEAFLSVDRGDDRNNLAKFTSPDPTRLMVLTPFAEDLFEKHQMIDPGRRITSAERGHVLYLTSRSIWLARAYCRNCRDRSQRIAR